MALLALSVRILSVLLCVLGRSRGSTVCVIGEYIVYISRVVDGEVALCSLLVHISSVFHRGIDR